MGDILFKFDAETAKAVQGFVRLNEEQRKLAMESAKITGEGGKAKHSMDSMGVSSMAAGKAVSSLAAAGGQFMAAFASVGMITSLMNGFAEASERARQVMNTNWDAGVSVQSRLVALANQRGRSDNAGFMAAAVDAQNIAFGSGGTLDLGASIVQGAESTLGHLKQRDRMAIGMEVAGYAAAAGASPEDAAILLELLGKAGVQDAAGARKMIAQMYGGVLASSTTKAGKFATGTLKGLSAAMAMGMTFQEAIATFGQARAEGAGSEDVAGELAKQVVTMLNDPEIQKFITEYGGTPYEQLGPRQALDVLTQAMNDPKAKVAREKVIKGEKLSQLQRFTSPSAVKMGETVADAVANADPEAYNLYQQTFLESDLALENWYQADKDVKALQSTDARAVRDKMVNDLLEQQSGEFEPLREFIKNLPFGNYLEKEFEASDRNELDQNLETKNKRINATPARRQPTPWMDFGSDFTHTLLRNLFPLSYEGSPEDFGGSPAAPVQGAARGSVVNNYYGDTYVSSPEPVVGRHPNEPEVP